MQQLALLLFHVDDLRVELAKQSSESLLVADAVMSESSDTEYLQFWYSPHFPDSRLARSQEG